MIRPTAEALEPRRLLAATLLADITPGAGNSYPGPFVDAGDVAFFLARGDLWSTDGSPAGTAPVATTADVLPGEAHFLVAGNGRAYFQVERESGLELWTSDGTQSGTTKLANLPGELYDEHGSFVAPEWNAAVVGDVLYMAGEYELMSFVGATGASSVVARTYDLGVRSLSDLTGDESGLYFTGRTGRAYGDGDSVYFSDGSPAGTRLLGDLSPNDAENVIAGELTSVGGRAWLATSDGGVYAADPSGLTELAQFRPVPEDYGVPDFAEAPQGFTAVGDDVYFFVDQPSGFGGDSDGRTNTIYRTDGSAEGTTAVVTDEGNNVELIYQLAAAGGKLAYYAASGPHGIEPRLYDPANGTSTVIDLWPGPAYPYDGVVVGSGDLFYLFTDGDGPDGGGDEFYSLDPDDGSLARLTEFSPGPGVYTGNGYMVPFRGGILIAGHDQTPTGDDLGFEPYFATGDDGGTGDDDTLNAIRVVGTDGRDDVRVAGGDGTITVSLNGTAQTFDLAGVEFVEIDLGAGDDGAIVDPAVTARVYIFGGDGDDTLFGGSGHDTLTGGAGRNRLVGGEGDDLLNGSGGRDFLFGEGGDDRLYGNGGGDYMNGSAGVDRLFGGSEDDFMLGGSSNDKLYGQDGDDTLIGERQNDLVFGGNGDDLIFGRDGSDSLHGQTGNDTIAGQRGLDFYFGGDGDDVLLARNGDADTLDGGLGRDVAESEDEDALTSIEVAA